MNYGKLQSFYFVADSESLTGKNYPFDLKNDNLIISYSKADHPLTSEQNRALVANLYLRQQCEKSLGYEDNFYFTVKDFVEAKFMYE